MPHLTAVPLAVGLGLFLSADDAPWNLLMAAGLLLVILVVAFESSAMGTVMPRLAGDLEGLSLSDEWLDLSVGLA